jgi:hypothetical protein
MPNYTKNTLIVKGSKDVLTYFYNRNRMSEEDVQNVDGSVTDLSFEKCVSLKSDSVIMTHILENYHSKDPNRTYECLHLNYSMWGSHSNAIAPIVDLSYIHDDKITYYFETEHTYPHNWLVTISKIFHKLEFEIIYMNEDDDYDMCHKSSFKQGKFEMIEKYSNLERSIEKHGLENLVNMIIEECEKRELKAPNYINRLENLDKPVEYVYWKELCKLHIQEYENKDDDYEHDLVRTIVEEYLDDFLDKHDVYRGIFRSREFCKLFVEKVKTMIRV